MKIQVQMCMKGKGDKYGTPSWRKNSIWKALEKHNMEAIWRECAAREIAFGNGTKWYELIKFIKQHEQDNKYFVPKLNTRDSDGTVLTITMKISNHVCLAVMLYEMKNERLKSFVWLRQVAHCVALVLNNWL